jgi:hypothetical protein
MIYLICGSHCLKSLQRNGIKSVSKCLNWIEALALRGKTVQALAQFYPSKKDLDMFMPPGFYNIENLNSQSPEIVEDLRRFEPKITVAKLAALLVRQEFHPNTLRLETLIHMAARYCEGRQPPKRKDMERWLNEHLGGTFAQMEDPVEDVFVSNICYEWGNARACH